MEHTNTYRAEAWDRGEPTQAKVHLITIPSGRKVTVGTYAKAWRALLTMPPDAEVPNWQWYPVPAASILRDMRDGLHDRINRKDPRYPRGRKAR